MGQRVRVGIISDTHGRLDERAEKAFRDAGLSAILHAGDVCSPHVLYDLEDIAPVTAVAGNCDYDGVPGWGLDAIARTKVYGVRFLVVHDLHTLGPIPEDVDVVVCGHSHRPREEWQGRTLILNPGSASQRRAQPSRTVGVLDIAEDGALTFELVALDDIGPAE